MSKKPTVFNYKDYTDAIKEINRLREVVANLEIRCRIAEEKIQLSKETSTNSKETQKNSKETQKNSNGLISIDNAIQAALDCFSENQEVDRPKVEQFINALPSADRPKGKWIVTEDEEWRTLECSFCGATGDVIPGNCCFNYCPNCGADMRGEEHE